jgi:hypothetical protein
MVCFGYLFGRLVVVGFVQRGDARYFYSMRKANEREHVYHSLVMPCVLHQEQEFEQSLREVQKNAECFYLRF